MYFFSIRKTPFFLILFQTIIEKHAFRKKDDICMKHFSDRNIIFYGFSFFLHLWKTMLTDKNNINCMPLKELFGITFYSSFTVK